MSPRMTATSLRGGVSSSFIMALSLLLMFVLSAIVLRHGKPLFIVVQPVDSGRDSRRLYRPHRTRYPNAGNFFRYTLLQLAKASSVRPSFRACSARAEVFASDSAVLTHRARSSPER